VTAAAEFARLAGCELSAVCFVRSYVELHFDGPVLRLLAPPVVSTEEQTFEFPIEGSRDVLCELIGQTVKQADDEPDRLALTFPNNIKVEMLKSSPGTGPEVAHLVPLIDGAPDVASMVIWENLIPTRDDDAHA
jgi:hypothetical protein